MSPPHKLSFRLKSCDRLVNETLEPQYVDAPALWVLISASPMTMPDKVLLFSLPIGNHALDIEPHIGPETVNEVRSQYWNGVLGMVAAQGDAQPNSIMESRLVDLMLNESSSVTEEALMKHWQARCETTLQLAYRQYDDVHMCFHQRYVFVDLKLSIPDTAMIKGGYRFGV
ncbi:hypothetical protein AB6D11_00495 [Vibrio splendidus]